MLLPCPSCGKDTRKGVTYCMECGQLFHDNSPWWDHSDNDKLRKRNRKLLKKNLELLESRLAAGELSEHDYHVQLDEMLERLGIHSKLLKDIRNSL